MIRVLIADDHHLFREGLVRILNETSDLQVVASLSRGEEAVAQAAALRPDVILMDVNMPGIGGLEAARRLRAGCPQARVLMLTVSEQESDLFAAVRAGARGYLLKSATSVELVEAVQRVARGEAIIAPVMAARLLDEFAAMPAGVAKGEAPTAEEVTERERQVLQMVAKGMSNKEIGAALNLSPHTIKAHLRSILDKLHLRSRSEAAAWAATHGL
ncbi:MAG: response regulator transcription factor [Chloroflexi bacterium]|nr:response regulator transcription factor [Chloroflexota bacterium]